MFSTEYANNIYFKAKFYWINQTEAAFTLGTEIKQRKNSTYCKISSTILILKGAVPMLQERTFLRINSATRQTLHNFH